MQHDKLKLIQKKWPGAQTHHHEYDGLQRKREISMLRQCPSHQAIISCGADSVMLRQWPVRRFGFWADKLWNERTG